MHKREQSTIICWRHILLSSSKLIQHIFIECGLHAFESLEIVKLYTTTARYQIECLMLKFRILMTMYLFYSFLFTTLNLAAELSTTFFVKEK